MSTRKTDQKNAAPHPEEAERRSSPDAIAECTFKITSEGLLASNVACSETNPLCPIDDPTGKTHDQLLSEETAKRFQVGLEKAKNLGESQVIRYQKKIGDTVHFFEARIAPVIDGDFTIAAQQIDPQSTETNSSTDYDALISRLPGALYNCLYDDSWTVVSISSGIEEFLGYSASEFFTPGGLSLIDVIYEPDQPYVRRLVDDAARRNAPFIIEYRMVHADGSLRWVNEQGQTILDSAGNAVSIEGIIMDVTESYKLREKASIKNAHFSSVGIFGAGVAHEINNALAIMMANLDYAVEELENVGQISAGDLRLSAPLDDINQSLSKLNEGMKRVQKIVQDLRSYSDAASNKQTETIDLVRLLEWALHEIPVLQEHAQIIRDFPDDSAILRGNQLGLLQVFTHLLSNAEKSLDPEKAAQNEVTISLKKIPNNAILIEIEDTGTGIDPEVLPQIFEPFFSTRPIGDGTGLGLFVCQGIVRSMDGEILISSTPEKGTTVQIILPTKL